MYAHPDEARDVDARAEQLQVLYQLLRLVLGVQNSQLCKEIKTDYIESRADFLCTGRSHPELGAQLLRQHKQVPVDNLYHAAPPR